MIVFMLLLVGWCEVGPQIAVYRGPTRMDAISIRSDQLGRPVDLAYDAQKRRVVGLIHVHNRFWVREWSRDGTLREEWRLPEQAVPMSVLHCREGLRLLAWEKARKQEIVVTLVRGKRHSVHSADLKTDALEYDQSLNPTTVRVVREAMRELHWVPYWNVYGGSADSSLLIDYHTVNTRPWNTPMAWTRDYSVMSFGWPLVEIQLDIAIREPGGAYRVADVSRMVMDAVAEQVRSCEQVWLRSMVVRRNSAAYCVEIGDAGTRPITIWFERTRAGWKVVTVRTGYLAREIERF